MANLTSGKSYDSGIQEAINRSIVSSETSLLGAPGIVEGGATSLFMMAGAAFADALPPWGSAPTRRDMMLRWFIQTEPIAASDRKSVV